MSSVSGLGLGGLISGMSTDEIIQKISTMEQTRIDTEKGKVADIQAKQDAWSRVKNALSDLRLKLDKLRMSSAFHIRTATASDATVADVSAASGATVGVHSLSVTQMAHTEVVGGKPAMVSGAYPTGTTALGLSGTINLAVGSATATPVTVNTDDTLYSIRDKINAAGAGITADVITVNSPTDGTYSELKLTSNTSGVAGAISLSDGGTSGLLQSLGLTSDFAGTAKNEVVTAQDALFNLDNQAYQTSSNTIKAIPNLTITLKKETGSTDVTVGQDASGLTKAVQDWATSLNASMDTLKDLTSYDSSTKQAGLLNGDSLARSILNQLRSVMDNKLPELPSGFQSFADVGITTGAYGTEDYGHVVVDTAKLTNALAKDENSLARLFGGMRLDTNLSLPANGGTVSASDTDPGTTLANAIDGITNDAGWKSNGAPTSGDITTAKWLSVDFASAKSIDQVRLFTQDGASASGIKNFNLQYQDSAGNWVTLQSVTNYTGTSRTISFDPVTTQHLRLQVTDTYGGTEAQVSDLQVMASNNGLALSQYRFVNNTLAFNTGSIDTRNATYNDQIKKLNDQIADMTTQMATEQQKLKDQFDAMEQAMAQLQQQGNQLAAMLGMAPAQK